MVNPGAFTGSRRSFLADQQSLYAAAVTGNHVADTVADIQRRYFKRYPMSLPHDQEPTEEWLAQVDDTLPDPEFKAPDMDAMDHDAYVRESLQYDELARNLKMRKDVGKQ